MDAKTDHNRVDAALNENARDLAHDPIWLENFLDVRLRSHFGTEIASPRLADFTPPDLSQSGSIYAEFLRAHDVVPAVRLIIVLALVPHVRPQLLDVLWVKNDATQRGFTEFGGTQNATHGGFMPTGETALFLLAGTDLGVRFDAMRLFEGDQLLAREGVLRLSPAEPAMSGALMMSQEHLDRFTTGIERRPTFSRDFPARLIHTELSFEDLVLPAQTLDQLEEIKRWVVHGDALLRSWGMEDKLEPGFTCLFYGPPGTGKTLSACLLGKHCECDVFKIDLSMIVSKYIGETEKNLARIFDMAEHRRWILFFDEADALFGKRTRVDDARDRFANQEVSFLLQRIEGVRRSGYPGLELPIQYRRRVPPAIPLNRAVRGAEAPRTSPALARSVLQGLDAGGGNRSRAARGEIRHDGRSHHERCALRVAFGAEPRKQSDPQGRHRGGDPKGDAQGGSHRLTSALPAIGPNQRRRRVRQQASRDRLRRVDCHTPASALGLRSKSPGVSEALAHNLGASGRR
jgi:hypothetical protein